MIIGNNKMNGRGLLWKIVYGHAGMYYAELLC